MLKKRNRGTYFRKGDNNVICQRTGAKIKASDSVREWNGLIVHKHEFEERHPQDFVRGVSDNQAAKVSSPESTDYFILTDTEVQASDL